MGKRGVGLWSECVGGGPLWEHSHHKMRVPREWGGKGWRGKRPWIKRGKGNTTTTHADTKTTNTHQSLHGDHADTMQPPGHGDVAHASVCTVKPQLPPSRGGTVTLRLRDREPVPQSALSQTTQFHNRPGTQTRRRCAVTQTCRGYRTVVTQSRTHTHSSSRGGGVNGCFISFSPFRS